MDVALEGHPRRPRRPADDARPDPTCGGGLPRGNHWSAPCFRPCWHDATGRIPERACLGARPSEESRARTRGGFQSPARPLRRRAVPVPAFSASGEVDRFTLKGAALFRVWTETELRPTPGCGLSRRGRRGTSRDPRRRGDRLRHSLPGGRRRLRRRDESGSEVSGATSRRAGCPTRLQGHLGNIRLALQMDIGFGDRHHARARAARLSHPLDLPAPCLWTYPREAMIAEKFEAMVSRGVDNSRVKDLWDIACLARRFAFDGDTLRTAIAETYRRRETSFTSDRPPALLPDYHEDGRARATLAGPAPANRHGRRRSGPSRGRRRGAAALPGTGLR